VVEPTELVIPVRLSIFGQPPIIDDDDEHAMANDDEETYILLLLSDSNLPTGSFVASSGLESFVKHGFFPSHSPDSMINFIQDSLATYAHSALPFVSDAHHIVAEFSRSLIDDDIETTSTLSRLKALDELYETMTLNHVAKRASKSQGVALLTLYSKGFSKPAFLELGTTEVARETRLLGLVDRLKLVIRREETQGHLPICWGVLTGAFQLSLGVAPFFLLFKCDSLIACVERAQYLHLFLHARSLLSAAVRLNVLGPYGAQQLLLHAVRPLIDREVSRCKHLHTGIHNPEGTDFDETLDGPATTWPLGEILATRHDLQHSRIFNS
jgi:urease accessory protein